jgi:hypothetical protein
MGRMRLGYGSEYQLLRFLGHHRDELEKNIINNARYGGKMCWLDFPPYKGKIRWLDYPFNKNRISLDGEYKDIEFLANDLPMNTFQQLQAAWSVFWPQSGNSPNWDAIFICKKDNRQSEYVLVEAKARIKEMKSDCKAKGGAALQIRNSLDNTKNCFGIPPQSDWTRNYYQLANRLAFVKFLLTNGINASLLYIYFINGYKNNTQSVPSVAAWRQAIDRQDSYLGIKGTKAMDYISSIFVDCEP